jgi:hypothetical protein
MPRRFVLGALIAAAAAALLATPAWAAPVPGCAGTAFTDAAGDATDTTVPGVDGKGQPNLDVLSGFFLADGGTVTANIQVANLTTDVPATATGVDWYMIWTNAAGALKFVRASVAPGGDPAFSYGTVTVTDANTLYTDDGETSGQFFTGPNGVVQIQVPADLAGGTLKAPHAATSAEQDFDTGAGISGGRLATADNAPDEGGGSDYAIGGCTSTPTTTPAPDVGGPSPVASTPAGQAPSSAPSGSSAPARPAALHVAVRRTSARTVSRRHALTVAVSTTAPLTQVKALLLDRRGKKVGSGALARLSGKGTLKLRVRRTLRKGTYTVRVTGRDGSGTVVSKLARVTLAR